ncbi:MAG: hypothetical protein Q4C67_05585 [Deinococcus sp.]|nr:hypothetical protein [Deinococcus sp.]
MTQSPRRQVPLWTALLGAALAFWLGIWVMSPKSGFIQTLCENTPLCLDPLVYLSNGEQQPYASQDFALNLRPLESRQIDLHFNTGTQPLALPADLRLSIVRVERQWYDLGFGPLSYRPTQSESPESLLYEDHELTVTTPVTLNKWPTIGFIPLTVTAKRPLSQGRSVLSFHVQKPGTRWGGSGQVSLTVWTHQK